VDDAETLRANLAKSGIKAAVRAGSVRLSTHVYNTPADIQAAVSALSLEKARQPVTR
jgi:selenocysteine lyase/cysteine desulfurase